jgi:hypothetical protein
MSSTEKHGIKIEETDESDYEKLERSVYVTPSAELAGSPSHTAHSISYDRCGFLLRILFM